MHDPKIVEAMARAIGARLVLRGSVNDAATDALRDLCSLRPDLAAVLRGEAVVVPREATDAMASRVNGTCVTVTIDGTWAVTRQEAKRIHAALIAASPHAQESPHGR